MPKNPPDGYHTITPQIIAEDARDTVDFISNVFGGKTLEIYEEGERIVHSEIEIGDSRIMVASATEEFPVFPAMTNVYVEDVDATYRRALDNGATTIRQPENQFYGDRTAGVVDGQGNQWWIATRIEDVSPEEIQRRMAELAG